MSESIVSKHINQIVIQAKNLDGLKNINHGINDMQKNLGNLEGKGNKLTRNFGKIATRTSVLAGAKVAAMIYLGKEFENTMLGIKTRMEGVEEFGGIDKAREEIFRLAKATHQSAGTIAELWGEWANFNIVMEQAAKMTPFAAKVAVATGRSLMDIGASIGRMHAEGLGLEEVEKTFYQMEAMANTMSNVRFDPLLEAVDRNIGKANIDTLLALSSAMQMASIDPRKQKSLFPQLLGTDLDKGISLGKLQDKDELASFSWLIKEINKETEDFARKRVIQGLFGATGDAAFEIDRLAKAWQRQGMNVDDLKGKIRGLRNETSYLNADFEENMNDPAQEHARIMQDLATEYIDLSKNALPWLKGLNKALSTLNTLLEKSPPIVKKITAAVILLVAAFAPLKMVFNTLKGILGVFKTLGKVVPAVTAGSAGTGIGGAIGAGGALTGGAGILGFAGHQAYKTWKGEDTITAKATRGFHDRFIAEDEEKRFARRRAEMLANVAPNAMAGQTSQVINNKTISPNINIKIDGRASSQEIANEVRIAIQKDLNNLE